VFKTGVLEPRQAGYSDFSGAYLVFVSILFCGRRVDGENREGSDELDGITAKTHELKVSSIR